MNGLSGELTQFTVPGLIGAATRLAANGALDLSTVTRADSAGLALLLELKRRARRNGATLTLIGAPPQLLGLARFFSVSSLLDLE